MKRKVQIKGLEGFRGWKDELLMEMEVRETSINESNIGGRKMWADSVL